MWYIECLMSICMIALLGGSVYFSDMASEQYQVNCETVRLVNIFQEIQERSQNYHLEQNGDFIPSCSVYQDRYVIRRFAGNEGSSETYYLRNGVRIDTGELSGLAYIFKERSLYGGTTNKTLKVYKNKTSKYIAINRVGRIRIYDKK